MLSFPSPDSLVLFRLVRHACWEFTSSFQDGRHGDTALLLLLQHGDASREKINKILIACLVS